MYSIIQSFLISISAISITTQLHASLTMAMLVLTATLLLRGAVSTIYYVQPDLDGKTASDQETLQHYQENGELYFTSNTQLHFQSGVFHLRAPLIIRMVQNFSFVGSHNTTIICDDMNAGVVIAYSVTVNINNVSIRNCAYNIAVYNEFRSVLQSYAYKLSNVLIIRCKGISIYNSSFFSNISQGLSLYDIEGISTFVHFSSNSLLVNVSNTTSDTKLRIVEYTYIPPNSGYLISIILGNHSNEAILHISQLVVTKHLLIYINVKTCAGNNIVTFDNLMLTNLNNIYRFDNYTISINLATSCKALSRYELSSTHIHFNQCQLKKLNNSNLVSVNTQQNDGILYAFFVQFSNSIFSDISNTDLITSKIIFPAFKIPFITLGIMNSVFKNIQTMEYLINIKHTKLMLIGPIYFTNIFEISGSILLTSGNNIVLQNYIEFSHTNSFFLIITDFIIVGQHTLLNITSNIFNYGIKSGIGEAEHLCTFQYFRAVKQHSENRQASEGHHKMKGDYLITFNHNSGTVLFVKKYSLSHCEWLENSVFLTFNPQIINQQYIKYTNNSFALLSTRQNHICICLDDHKYNCTIDELMPVYPGQKYSIKLVIKNVKSPTAMITFDQSLFTSCKGQSDWIEKQIFEGKCTAIDFTFLFKNRVSCELYLTGISVNIEKTSSAEYPIMEFRRTIRGVYHVNMIPCPYGFILNKLEGVCQCDPLIKHSILQVSLCNITQQTILRPGKSWITAYANNGSYNYRVSPHCPFDYCLPYSSHLNLSTPNSQCQFNRSGLLCGQCQHGLSTVFGSSKCQKCSNVYLLLIIPIALAGILFVFLLFIFNLTVTDGDINSILLYANIVGINKTILSKPHRVTYMFVSIANLDLGMETCFYNGMNDYAKMWLQLAFPVYLITLAIVLIMASRYSVKVQRLTARRALPVLATLFVLSYTKVLRTVSYVLFFYQTVTYLPSEHTELLWSVEISIAILGMEFILFFIVSILLLTILTLFNIILVFARFLSFFHCINHFKPLLDAYHGPYKDKFYYWTGLQLVMRTVFFGLSALDRDTNLMLSILITGVATAIHGVLYPFKKKSRNIQELLILLNLQAIFVISLYPTSIFLAMQILHIFPLLQFAFVILKHIKKQWLKGFFINLSDKIRKSVGISLQKYIKYFKPVGGRNNEYPLINAIPEVTYNYSEFQEPLIGEYS